MDHTKTPFFTKLKEYTTKNIAPFDVPGHKMGAIADEFLAFVGHNTLALDVNAPRGLDNLNNPSGVIKEAQALAADAFLADRAYFLTGGTTQGIIAMIMACCAAKEKIIMPRNVHKSVINALILSGALPIFVKPHMSDQLGIANGITVSALYQTIKEHPDAKAVFVINPTYFGVTSDLKKIVDLAHKHNMAVLVDEAHGAHFAFSKQLPLSAMQAGADAAACSLHKTIGSLTQSSVLLTKGNLIEPNRIKSILNILRSTSPSSLLMASIDVSRKNIYFNGQKELERIISLASFARDKINKIPGLFSVDGSYFADVKEFGYDQTKLIIKVSNLGISGFDAYKELFDVSNIQLELAETHLILALLTIGTTKEDIMQLISGLEKLSLNHIKDKKQINIVIRQTIPEAFTRPREAAAHAPKKYVSLDEALGEIAAESIMIYPPGIPIVIPGEVFSKEIIDDLRFYHQQGSTILSDTSDGLIKVIDKEKWIKWGVEE